MKTVMQYFGYEQIYFLNTVYLIKKHNQEDELGLHIRKGNDKNTLRALKTNTKPNFEGTKIYRIDMYIRLLTLGRFLGTCLRQNKTKQKHTETCK